MTADPAGLSVDRLDLAGMDTGTNLDPERPHRPDDRSGAAHRAGRSVERREEPVARRVDLMTAEPREKRPHLRVVLLDDLLPQPISLCRRALRRADHVREQHGGEHPIEDRALLVDRVGEALDRPGDLDDVTEVGIVLVARDPDEVRAGDLVRRPLGFLDQIRGPTRSHDHGGRHLDRRQRAAGVGREPHAAEGGQVPRSGPVSLHLDQPLHEGGIACQPVTDAEGHPSRLDRPTHVAPKPEPLSETLLELVLQHPPRIVGRRSHPNGAAPENEAEGPVGISRREQRRERATVASPNTSARSAPAASSTARRRRAEPPRWGSIESRSDRPTPRLSNRITRAHELSLRIKRSNVGSSQKSSTCDTNECTNTMSIGPSPTT